jgi:hypothetical protein
MAQYSPTTVTTGQLYTATIINADRSAVATAVNSVDNSQVSASANIAISKTALGTYTTYTTFLPATAGNGSMTLSSIVTNDAKYTQIGKTVTFQVDVSFTTGGTADAIILFTPPVTPTVGLYGSCQVADGGEIGGTYIYDSGSGKVQVRRYDGAVFTLGAGRGFRITGSYQVT